MLESVILVDRNDQEVGIMEKIQAHREGVLHRAFSIFIFNSNGQMLLQKRAENKYHSGGLWTNSCCSHPRPGERIQEAAYRRLDEEFGFTTSLEFAFSFIYKAGLDNDLTEHELDHVFIGWSDDIPVPDPDEISEWRYVDVHDIVEEMESSPEKFTEWFKIAFPMLLKRLNTVR